MRRATLIFVAVLVVTGLASHLLVIRALPTIIMNRGTAVIADLGVVPNQWFIAPRITAENSAVVRASPDLAYAVCLLDLTEGPVQISAPGGADYGSLSVFDDDTTNVFVRPLHENQPLDILVHQKGETIELPPGATAVALSSTRGIALLRRLAPSQALYEAAQGLMDQSRCGLR